MSSLCVTFERFVRRWQDDQSESCQRRQTLPRVYTDKSCVRTDPVPRCCELSRRHDKRQGRKASRKRSECVWVHVVGMGVGDEYDVGGRQVIW